MVMCVDCGDVRNIGCVDAQLLTESETKIAITRVHSTSWTEDPLETTEVGTKSPGRQGSCPKISDNSLKSCTDNALESASELRLFQPNIRLDTRITPERCAEIPSTRSQEKF